MYDDVPAPYVQYLIAHRAWQQYVLFLFNTPKLALQAFGQYLHM